MTTIAPYSAPVPSIPAPVAKAAAPAIDGAQGSNAPGQPVAAQKLTVGYTPEILAIKAYVASPEYRESMERWRLENAQRAPEAPYTYRTAGEVAADGKMLTGLLSGAVDHVNAMRSHLDPEFLGRIRAVMGDEVANKSYNIVVEALVKGERALSRLQDEIGEKFVISGTLARQHDDGSMSLGAYALSFSGAGGSVRIGSDGSTFAAQSDGSYKPYDPG